MIILEVGNVETDITGDVGASAFQSDFVALRKKMSFRPDGYLFMPLYRQHKWDGWKRLLWKNSKRCYFPSGLLSIAREFLTERKIPHRVVDRRKKPVQNLHLEYNEKYKLRDYQQRIVDAAFQKERGIIHAATASGKTISVAGLIHKCAVKPFFFLVTSIDLLEQTKERLEEALSENKSPLKVGRIGGGVIDIRDVNVMTVQTAVRALGKKFIKFDNDSQLDNMDSTLLKKHRTEIVNQIKQAQGVFLDECVSGDTLITTKDGDVPIKKLYNYIGKEVLSFDGNSPVWKKVTHFYPKGKQKTFKITLSNGMAIRCTKNHPIMTKRGWIRAEDIIKNDKVLCSANVDADSESMLKEDIQANTQNIFKNIKLNKGPEKNGKESIKNSACNTNYAIVESITSCGSEYVFDITVEDTHCFFANDILVHNCQHCRADMCQLTMKAFENAYYRWGGSGTPYRDSGDDLLIHSCFGKKICEVQASELIKKGWLVPPTITFVHLNPPSTKYNNWQNIYKEQIVENEYYNNLVANIAEEYIKADRLILVLVQQIEHGRTLEQMIEGSLFICGDSPKTQRISVLKKLRNRYIKCIISTSLWDEGIDCKPLDTLLLVGQGKSPTRAMQRIGRVLRPYKNKDSATVIDFFIHEKYLEEHAKAREKMYKTEKEFKINHEFV